MNTRENKRKEIILKIRNSLKKLTELNLECDYDALTTEIMGEYFTSRRTALEYIDSAKILLKTSENLNPEETNKEIENILGAENV